MKYGDVMKSDGWQKWAPRDEISPGFSVDEASGALVVNGRGKDESFGAWTRTFPVDGGANYVMSAKAKWNNVAHAERSVVARLNWLDEKGERVRPADHAVAGAKQDGWTSFKHATHAPKEAKSVRIELSLWWSGGEVTWDDVRLDQAAELPTRKVRVATIGYRPRNTGSAAASVKEFCKIIDAQPVGNWDIICLPEGISVCGTGKKYADVAEKVPGPLTDLLGETARRAKSYIVAGVYERIDNQVHNIAVLIDRQGKVVGKYSKTHLPQEEAESGITAGDQYPVFDTDFGKIGITICWDLQFPEPFAAMAHKGVELILLPIWGGNEILARARAIENHCYLVSSSYDMKSMIIDPMGTVLAEVMCDKTPCTVMAGATIDLEQPVIDLPWLGNLRGRVWSERRTDLSVRS